MKTTPQAPDVVFRRAKATAAARDQTLQAFVTEALRDKLGGRSASRDPAGRPSMRRFGKLRALKGKTPRIQRRIVQEFERVEPEDRA